MPYPLTPGHKTPGTSAEAAQAAGIRSSKVRDSVLRLLANECLTADECAVKLGESKLYVRPRLSELRTMGLISKTDLRRKNFSGQPATVWKAN